jgi:hypothetical protein
MDEISYGRSKNGIRAPVCLTSLLLMLSACGGGGGGSSPPPPPPPPSYTLSATVSGLSGVVVLRVNGTADVSLSTNGAATLATALSDGASYSVVVASQPAMPAQVCTVANGSGTIAGANVSNVAIACSTTPLALLGSVPASGASGVARDSSMSLSFSAPLDPSVAITAPSAAGNVTLGGPTGNVALTTAVSGSQLTVTPGARLQAGVLYTLSISTAIHGSLGEPIPAPLTLTFTTAGSPSAGTWAAPTLLEDDDGDAARARIAIDSNGNALAVWDQFDFGGHTRIWTNRYSPASGWGTGSVLSPATGDGSGAYPQVALDSQGNGLVVWHETVPIVVNGAPGYTTRLKWSRYTPGGGLSVPAELGTGDAAVGPELAMNAAGDAVVVWREGDASAVRASRYAAGLWSAPVGLRSDLLHAAINPHVAINSSGNAVAVWAQSDGTRYSVWASRFSSGSGSGWGTAQLIEDHDGPNEALDPQVGIDAAGNAIVVWSESDGTRANIWASRYAGSWGAPVPLENANTGDAITPRVAVDPAGNAFVVWDQGISSVPGNNIMANHFTPGGGWGEATLIEHDDAGGVQRPQIAMNASGVAVATWIQVNTGALTRYDIRVNRFEPGAGWGTEVFVSPDSIDPQFNAFGPQVAINDGGATHVLWLRDDLNRNSVWSTHLEP